MANVLDAVVGNSTNSENKGSAKSAAAEAKSGNSLFDDLLNQVKSDIKQNDKAIQNSSTQVIKETEVSQKNLQQQAVQNSEAGIENEQVKTDIKQAAQTNQEGDNAAKPQMLKQGNSNVSQKSSGTSLLDKLVLEASAELKNDNSGKIVRQSNTQTDVSKDETVKTDEAKPVQKSDLKQEPDILQKRPQKNIDSVLDHDRGKGNDFKVQDEIIKKELLGKAVQNIGIKENSRDKKEVNSQKTKEDIKNIKSQTNADIENNLNKQYKKETEKIASSSLFDQLKVEDNDMKVDTAKSVNEKEDLKNNKEANLVSQKQSSNTKAVQKEENETLIPSKESSSKNSEPESDLSDKKLNTNIEKEEIVLNKENIKEIKPEKTSDNKEVVKNSEPKRAEVSKNETAALQNRPEKNIDSSLDYDQGKGNDFKVQDEILNKGKEQKAQTLKGSDQISVQKQSNEQIVVKNEKVAKELAKIDNSLETTEEKVNISKQKLESLVQDNKKEQPVNNKNQKEQPKSLLDKLIEDPKKSETKSSEILKEPKTAKDPLLTNIYISSQRKSADIASMQNATIAKEIAKNAKNVDDLKQSAKMLDLELGKSEIIHEEVSNKLINKDRFLDRLAFTKDVMKHTLKTLNDTIAVKSKESAANTSSTSTSVGTSAETTVELNVSNSIINTIQSRIVGARQAMGTFMSDVARSMYQNYKPPVTAFRLNLNPAHLGNIAIIMKSERDNGISISLNMSNSATLDSFVDNQGILRAALTKTFSDAGSFALNFGMQQESSNYNQSSAGDQNQNSNNSSAQKAEITDSEEDRQNIETSNYM